MISKAALHADLKTGDIVQCRGRGWKSRIVGRSIRESREIPLDQVPTHTKTIITESQHKYWMESTTIGKGEAGVRVTGIPKDPSKLTKYICGVWRHPDITTMDRFMMDRYLDGLRYRQATVSKKDDVKYDYSVFKRAKIVEVLCPWLKDKDKRLWCTELICQMYTYGNKPIGSDLDPYQLQKRLKGFTLIWAPQDGAITWVG